MLDISPKARESHDASSEEDEEEMKGLMNEELKQEEDETPYLRSHPKLPWWQRPSVRLDSTSYTVIDRLII